MKEFVKNFSKGAQIWLWIFASAILVWWGMAFAAAAWGALPNAGTTLSSAAWNDIVSQLNTLAGAIGVSGGSVGIGTPSPDAAYKLDVNGKIKGAGTAEAWSAKNTGVVWQTASWTAIPWLTTTFTLSRPATVHLASGGVQRYVAGSYCHVGYRYVVDGVGRWEPTWWQRIQMSDWTTLWHAGWNLIESESLPAGTHTIKVEAHNIDTSNWCVICGESNGTAAAYDGCAMNVSVFYQ